MSNLVPTNRRHHLAERGLTTVEYAIGLLGAAAAALLLLRIFSDNAFFEMAFKFVTDIFGGLVGIESIMGFFGG